MGTPESEAAEAHSEALAHSGRYCLEPPDRFVTDVDFSPGPVWVGAPQSRRCALRGDRLDIARRPGWLVRFGDFDAMTCLGGRRET